MVWKPKTSETAAIIEQPTATVIQEQKDPEPPQANLEEATEALDLPRTEFVETSAGLTCLKDVKQLSVALCEMPFNNKAANPFKDQTPKNILERQYMVANFTISTSFTEEVVTFPNALFLVPALANALSTFKYFRSNLEIAVKINATPYQKGMVMVTFEHDLPNTTPTWNVVQKSTFHPMLLNFSSADQVMFTVGWLNPELYTETSNYGTGCTYPQGVLRITKLVQLEYPTTSSATVQATVYARFINPTVAGFLSSQMSMGKGKFDEQQDKSENALTVTSKRPSILDPIFSAVNDAMGVAGSLASVFDKFSGIFDKPRSLQAPMFMIPNELRHVTNCDGLDPSVRFSMYQKSMFSQNIFPAMCETSNMSFTALAQIPLLYDVLALQNSAPSVTITAIPNNYGTIETGTPDYLNYVSAAFRWWRGSIKYMLIFVTDAFTTAKVRISYVTSNTGTTTYGGDYPSIVLDIKGTTYTDFQVPYLWYTPYRKYNENVETSLNYPRIVIELLTTLNEISGFSTLTVVIWRAGGEDFQVQQPCTAQVSITALSTNTLTTPTSNTELMESQCDVKSYFKKKFSGLGCECTYAHEVGYCSSELPAYVCDLLKRPTELADEGAIPWVPVSTDIAPQWKQPLYYFIRLFKYYRGSRRYITVLSQQENDVTFVNGLDFTSSDLPDQAAGWSYASAKQIVMSNEIPHMGMHPYYPIIVGNSASTISVDEIPIMWSQVINELSSTDMMYLVSCGDDVNCSYLMPTPDYNTFLKVSGPRKKLIPAPKGKEKENFKEIRTDLIKRSQLNKNRKS
jgi:hypothetical protein